MQLMSHSNHPLTACSSCEAISTDQPQNVDVVKQLRTQAHTIISEEPQPILMDSPCSTEMESILWQTTLCIKCDSMGAVFRSTSHDFSVVIPEGAVPEGVVISIEIGLTLTGPFDYPSLDESKPVSPILKLYVQDKPDFQFLKPVEVMLPHYLDLTSEDDSRNLGVEFLRAGHAMNSNQMYKFEKMGESNMGTFKNNFGILFTKHFCFLCIVAKITPQYVAKVKHFLVGYGVVKPYEQKLYFCVAYFLKTCIEVCSRIEVLCFHWCTTFNLYVFKTVNAAFVRPDLQSFPPPNYHLPVDNSRP